jgi:hypothetical protein
MCISRLSTARRSRHCSAARSACSDLAVCNETCVQQQERGSWAGESREGFYGGAGPWPGLHQAAVASALPA